MSLIKEQLEDTEVVRLTSFIESDREYQNLFNQLALQFGKMETMIAIEQCSGNRKKVLQFLESGKSSSQVSQKQNKKEKQFIRNYLEGKDAKEIRDFMKKNKVDEMAYREIIQKLYAKDKTFQ